MIGQTIGNFRVLSRLGAGGMGEVFLAEHVTVRTRVAIKLLRETISADHMHVQRFFNEAVAVSRIKHSGTAKIYDVGFHGSQAYLIMELLEGESLATRITRCGRLGPHRIAEIGRQITSILDATHAAHVLHRDLKPDNIFLVPDTELASGERVKILDFGIAKLADASHVLTGAQTAMGTPAYMAPEQWRDSATVDWRVDAYSLGCVAFEMATGRPPFVAASLGEVCTKHLMEPAPSVRSLAPDQPEALERLVARLLSKTPAERGESIKLIGAAFVMAVEGVPVRDEIDVQIAETLLPRSDTTLGSAAGQHARELDARPRRGKLYGGVAVGVLGTIVAIAIAVGDRGQAPVPLPTPTSSSPKVAEAEVPVVPIVAPDTAKVAVAQPDAATTPPVVAEPETAMVTWKIESTPPGAEVYREIGGFVGRTPVAWRVVQGSASEVFLVRRAGYREARAKLTTEADLTRRVQLVELPKPRPKQVESTKPTATPPAPRPKRLEVFDEKKQPRRL
ncbi:MAG: protein kinase [Deltaproteobacteria bacterium]|nr:protein kinase [Deltaproteobacteria bacterium]